MMIHRVTIAALGLCLAGLQARADDSGQRIAQSTTVTSTTPAQSTTTTTTAPAAPASGSTVVVTPPAQPPPPQNTTVVTPPAAPTASTTVTYEPRTGLIIGGLTTFGVAYAVSAVASAAKHDTCQDNPQDVSPSICRTKTYPLYIPLAGPFIQLNYLQGNSTETVRALLVIDGVAQIAGVAMFLVGISTSGEPAHVTESRSAWERMHFIPLASNDRAGMSAVGTF